MTDRRHNMDRRSRRISVNASREARERLQRGGLLAETLRVVDGLGATSEAAYSAQLSISTTLSASTTLSQSRKLAAAREARERLQRGGLSAETLRIAENLGAKSEAAHSAQLSISTPSQSQSEQSTAGSDAVLFPWRQSMPAFQPPPQQCLKSTSSFSSSQSSESRSSPNSSPNSSAMFSSTPSLATDTETLFECGSEASTNRVNDLAGQEVLELGNDGMLERNASTPYECAFWFLHCHFESYDKDEWLTHCLSHFRGNEPPKKAACPICPVQIDGADQIIYDEKAAWNGDGSWNKRMEHVAQSHHELGQSVKLGRPDQLLFKHLWAKRIINDADLKDLQTFHVLKHEPATTYQTTERSVGRRNRGSSRRG